MNYFFEGQFDKHFKSSLFFKLRVESILPHKMKRWIIFSVRSDIEFSNNFTSMNSHYFYFLDNSNLYIN